MKRRTASVEILDAVHIHSFLGLKLSLNTFRLNISVNFCTVANLVMSYRNISASYSDVSVDKSNRNSNYPTSAAAPLLSCAGVSSAVRYLSL